MKTYRGIPVQIKFQENETDPDLQIPSEVQLFKTGTYHHPVYGKIEITTETLRLMAENFKSNVRKIDIALDYKHDSDAEAAAWFEDVYLKEEGTELWFVPKWTPQGKDKVLSKEYKYISPDFTFNYIDNETLQEHGPTVLGAGLTNRPVIKGMKAIIELSEYEPKEIKMQELEQLKAKVLELERIIIEMKGKLDGNEGELAEKGKELDVVKQENKNLLAEKKLSEQNADFDKMLKEGKTCEAQRESFIKGDLVEFAKLSQPVKLSEQGHGKDKNNEKENTKDIEDQVIELAEKKVKESNIGIDEAISLVLFENKELNKKYTEKFQ